MTPRQAELGVDIATGLIVVSVASALAGLSWHLLASPRNTAAPASKIVARKAAPALVDMSPVLTLAPFGHMVSAIPEASEQAIELKGILFARPAGLASVMIASNGTTKGYRIGNALPNGAVVSAILVDHVVLDAGGAQSELSFPKAATATDPSIATQIGSTATMPSAPTSAGVAAIRALIPASVAGTGSAPVAGAIEAVRNQLDNPGSFLDRLGATPGAGGYRVGASPSPDLRQAGLMPGDVIERVNGVKVGDPQQDRALFDKVVAAGNARVDVLRDGRRYSLSFPIK